MSFTLASIKDWILIKSKWEQHIRNITLRGQEFNDEEISTTIDILLDEYQIEKAESLAEIDRNDIDIVEELQDSERCYIESVGDFKNINALEAGQWLTFGDGLTIVYGDNGVGKSGVARLLATHFFSRGNTEILPNLRIDEQQVISSEYEAQIKFNNMEETILITNTTTLPQKQNFCFFDNSIAKIHLEEENSISIVPKQFEIFERVNQYVEIIERSLGDYIESQYTHLLELSQVLDGEGSLVSNHFIELEKVISDSSQSYLDISYILQDLEYLNNFGHSQDLKIINDDIASIQSGRIDEELSSTKEKLTQINDIICSLINIEQNIYSLYANIVQAVNSYITAKTIRDGILEGEEVLSTNIDVDKRKSLLKIAKEIYEKGFTTNKCVLCKQDLNDTEAKLFEDYWELLNGEAERDLSITIDRIEELNREISDILYDTPSIEESHILFLGLSQYDAFNEFIDGIENINEFLRALLNMLDQKEIDEGFEELPIKKSHILGLYLDKLCEEVSRRETGKEALDKLIYRANHLIGKKTIAENYSRLVSHFIALDKIRKVNQIKLSFSTIKRNVSTKKGELYSHLFETSYIDVFNNYCNLLDCNFNIKPSTRVRRADSVKILELESISQGTHKISKILSEGEQKVAAIADFLTECHLDENNLGIIFDDPVTSLDNKRKKKIANALVNESHEKQVIIFTHDIPFYFHLIDSAGENRVSTTEWCMRKINNRVGIIDEDFPQIAMKTRTRKGKLQESLGRIRRLEENITDIDLYDSSRERRLKNLREARERAIEELLFHQTILRYRDSIQVGRLDKISNNLDIFNQYIVIAKDSWENVSQYVHDSSEANPVELPDAEYMTSLLETFIDFADNCKYR